jgi:hypothetical protein
MTIKVKITGGLGNQLFQYFFARSLNIKLKCNVELDVSEFTTGKYKTHDLNLNNLDLKLPFSVNKNFFLSLFFKPIVDKNPFKYCNSIFDNQYFNYIGYWQSYKYFEEYWSVFKKDFIFEKKISTNPLLDKIINNNSVSVHIRRGDYIANKKNSMIHGNLQISYYMEAIKLIKRKVTKPKFFFFSDDINWVKKNFNSEEFFFINNNPTEIKKPFKDLYLMKHCKHNIIANSTFSWWGAWLNDRIDKIVIAPKYWSSNQMSKTTDLIPPNWIIL